MIDILLCHFVEGSYAVRGLVEDDSPDVWPKLGYGAECRKDVLPASIA